MFHIILCVCVMCVHSNVSFLFLRLFLYRIFFLLFLCYNSTCHCVCVSLSFTLRPIHFAFIHFALYFWLLLILRLVSEKKISFCINWKWYRFLLLVSLYHHSFYVKFKKPFRKIVITNDDWSVYICGVCVCLFIV